MTTALATRTAPPMPYGVVVYPHVLNMDLCSRVISHFEGSPKGAQDHLLHGSRPTFAQVEVDERVGQGIPWMRLVLKRVRRGIDGYLDEFVAQPDLREEMKRGCFSLQPRIKRYDVGGYFPLHSDDASLRAQMRRIAYILYLNDGFEGGETVFQSGGGETCVVQPVAGAMLVFPVHPVYMHEGRPVTRGSKYILNGFATILTSQARATTLDGTPVSKRDAVREEIRLYAGDLLSAAEEVFRD